MDYHRKPDDEIALDSVGLRIRSDPINLNRQIPIVGNRSDPINLNRQNPIVGNRSDPIN